MAYQNPGTPRFYINVLEWLDKIGYSAIPSSHFNTLPVFPSPISNAEISIPYNMPNRYIAILGHNKESFSIKKANGSIITVDPNGIIINADSGLSQIQFEFAGWSLFQPSTDDNPSEFVFSGEELIGSILVGSYYDMSVAPDLSITMNREYGYTDNTTTYNGSSISNTMAFKPANWGELGAWELEDPGNLSQNFSNSGRRVWDLSFSYINDSDLWGTNQLLTNHMNSFIGFEIDDFIGENIYTIFTGNCEDDTGVNGLDSFASASPTEFQGNHAADGGISRAGTTQSIDVIAGQKYTVEFDLDLSSGVSPRVFLAVAFGGTKQSAIKTIDNSSGHYTLDFTGTVSNAGRLIFEHKADYAASQYTISNIQVYISSGGNAGFNYNTLTDDSFFTQVWQKTLGGSIPFIFQPDNTNNNPDQFAIAKIKKNSLEADRSASNVYDISFTVEEVW